MTTYEAHITFPNRLRRKVKRNAGPWKFSRMVGDPVLGRGKYCYLTTYGTNLSSLKAFCTLWAEEFKAAGIPPLRVKIEEEVYDRKISLDTEPQDRVESSS